jgi:hypothetical protein
VLSNRDVNNSVLIDYVTKNGAGSIEQCYAVEFCVISTKVQHKHMKSLKRAYGDQALSQAQVF